MIKRFTILISLFLLVFILPQAWGESFFDVWGSSSNDVFVVGDNGQILHYDGNSWSEMDSGSDGYLNAIWGSSNTDVYVVGSENIGAIVLHYDGNHWSKTVLGYLARNLRGIWGSSSSDIFAVGSVVDSGDNEVHAVLLHYDGNLWSRIFMGEAHNSSYAVWGFSNSDVFFSGGGNDRVYHYDGQTITKMPSSPVGIIGLWGSSHSSLYALSYSDEVYHYNGSIWAMLGKWNEANDDGNIWGNSDADVYVVRYPEYDYGDDYDLLRFNGSDFERTPCPSNGWFDDVWSSSSSDVYAVGGIGDYINGYKGLIVHYNGSTWSLVDLTSTNSPPTANAGPDQIIFDTITLDASLSSDPEGAPLTYEWTIQHTVNPDYNYTATGQQATITGFATGFYDVTLTITDSAGAIDTDTMFFSATGRKGDFDFDGDVDGDDLAEFSISFGM